MNTPVLPGGPESNSRTPGSPFPPAAKRSEISKETKCQINLKNAMKIRNSTVSATRPRM